MHAFIERNTSETYAEEKSVCSHSKKMSVCKPERKATRVQPYWILHLVCAAPQTVRKYIFAVLATHYVVFNYGPVSRLIQRELWLGLPLAPMVEGARGTETNISLLLCSCSKDKWENWKEKKR